MGGGGMLRGGLLRMIGPIETFMTEDHTALDALLRRADHENGNVDREAYAEFRERLLRHIAMEEKILLPLARLKRGGETQRAGRRQSRALRDL
jgi:hemerythrin-like domain-containing protein